ncbi:glycerophosphodiester phosphodiesterase family protein [Prauserella muralis]|uniref:Glycerophosphodiester phosphodiesterase n=1 Tax=Prauserella muralis TaxID=588067 RepID=A0A2V4ALS8_9PSEU|nr:glycerophosphodiester phosphodiesterase family protein [Prauserella muralis]PXY20934.1 glycerophosphodiester phosphodiesterase [Prauserella muralis]TWE29989.1 glycerophosphoryl diester phosphodiesterase [Prauserella muralis]
MRRIRSRSLACLLAATALTATGPALPQLAAADPGDVVVAESFDGTTLPEGFSPVAGQWEVSGGRLVNTQPGSLSRITFGTHLRDFRAEATVRFETVNNASRWAGIMLDIDPSGAVPWSQAIMRSQSSASNGIEFATRTRANTWNVTDTASAPYDAGTGRDVRMSVEVHGTKATWSFDGQTVLATTQLPRSADGVLGFIADGARISVDDVRVTELEPLPVTQPDGALPLTVAHRGYSSAAPENTLAAVEAGIRARSEYVEIDAHTTADGVAVVMHDSTVDRTTDGTGAVSSLTADYVTGLDAGSWFSPAFAGQRVPTLGQVLDLVKDSGSTLLLEVKGPETRAETQGIVEEVLTRGMTEQVLLQSFDEQVLRDARDLAPRLPLGLLRSSLDADPLATARDFGVVAYNPSVTALLTRPGTVGTLNDAGIAVMPYTIDDAARWEQLSELGVDAVITNRAGEHYGWRQRAEQDPAAAPTVAITAPADGATVRRHTPVTVAVQAAEADTVTLTLDGAPIEAGTPIDPRTLAAGRHTLTAVAEGPGGVAEAGSAFDVVVDPTGVRVLVAEAAVPAQHTATILRHLDAGRWTLVAHAVRAAPFTPEQERLLLGDIRILAGA